MCLCVTGAEKGGQLKDFPLCRHHIHNSGRSRGVRFGWCRGSNSTQVVTGHPGASVKCWSGTAGCQVERKCMKSDRSRGAQEPPLHIYFTILHCCKTRGETERGGGGGKSVLDLIFHTPASYKRLSYTTLAPNNQSGKGSQNDEIPCHLLPDLFSRVTPREGKKDVEERMWWNKMIMKELCWVWMDSCMVFVFLIQYLLLQRV